MELDLEAINAISAQTIPKLIIKITANYLRFQSHNCITVVIFMSKSIAKLLSTTVQFTLETTFSPCDCYMCSTVTVLLKLPTVDKAPAANTISTIVHYFLHS